MEQQKYIHHKKTLKQAKMQGLSIRKNNNMYREKLAIREKSVKLST